MFNDWVKARWLAKNPGPYKVGDRVRFRIVFTDVEGVIVEDRGNLGVGGRRLYGITFHFGESPEKYIELPVDEFQLAGATAPSDENGQAK